MSPIYEYRCPCGHVVERLRPMSDRHLPELCPQCAGAALLIISATHAPPDGVYSYAPNIGSPDAHDRKQEIIRAREKR
jgi:putative FmdB family regulatory protein